MTVDILGAKFEVAPEPADFWRWVSEGRYNHEWNLILKAMRPEDTVIDLGAWVGSHSLLASTVAKQVHAIEPDPVAFKILSQNIQPIDKIVSHRLAIMDVDASVTLGSGLLGASTTRVNPSAGDGIGPWAPGQEFTIECKTLRHFAENLPDPLFIKMDVEGAEEMILATDLMFFQERKPTFYLENHPFWWKTEANLQPIIRQLSKFYKHTLDINFRPVDLQVIPRGVLFTDREV